MMSVTKMATRRFSHVVGSRSHPALPLSFYSGKGGGGWQGGRENSPRSPTDGNAKQITARTGGEGGVERENEEATSQDHKSQRK